MDILFFLKIRTKFIRAFYEDACFKFLERKLKIKAGEHPFEAPYSEDGDPPFLDEWLEADESIDVLGQMCISMLSSSLKLYFEESINELLGRYSNESLAEVGVRLPEDSKGAFKGGWINCYRAYFREQFGIDWTKSQTNLGLLEEIVLARNRAQHPEYITTLRIKQSDGDAKKYPRSFFADEIEMRLLGGDQDQDEWVHPLRLNVTREKLLAAVDEVDRFCSWLDDLLHKWPGV
jgi:hypothetical protein